MKTEMHSNRKYYLDYLKGIAAIFVVIGHCISYQDSHFGVRAPFWLSMIGVIVSSVHVPMFFLIAGYLCHRKPYGQFIKQKVIRILIPFFTFSVIKLLFNTIVSSDYAHGSTVWEQLYDTFFLGGSYWFIYCMFIIYLLAPIGWKKENESNKACNIRIIAVFCVLFVCSVITQDLKWIVFPTEWRIGGFTAATPLTQAESVMMYFPYFLAGMLIQNNSDRIVAILRGIHPAVIGLLLIAALTVGCFVTMGCIDKGYFFKAIIAYSFMFFLYRMMLLLPDRVKVLAIPGKYSLHVMFFDSFFRVLLFAAIGYFMKPNAILTLVVAAGDVVLSCATSFVLSKIPMLRVVFGLKNIEKRQVKA